MVVAVVAATVFGLWLSGSAKPLQLADPGAVVRWGLPIARGIQDLASGITVGSLVFAAFALPANSKPLSRTLNLAAILASTWAVSAIFALVFTYLSVTGQKFSTSDSFGSGLWLFISEIQLGQYLALNLLAAVLVSVCAIVARKLAAVAFTAALALLGLVPLALTGHAAGTEAHSMAVNALGLHLVGVSVWVGGLVAVFGIRSFDSARKFVKRYSTLALFAYVLVAISGTASALLRMSPTSDLITPYGQLVLLKVIVLVVIGVLAALYRTRLLQTATSNRLFYRLVVLELGLMSVAMGLASALSRTAPPGLAEVPTDPTPAQILTGELLPPELTPLRWITSYKIDLIWAIVCVAGIGFYLAGVYRLNKRGDKWPIARTASWVLGMVTLYYITNGAPNVYEAYLFSVHMISHMMLTMAVPVLLVPGAPVTLLTRAVAKRKDDSRGIREWVLWAVHTKYAQFISHPLIAGINFASSLIVFYFTPLFSWSTREHIGHEWMVVHFLITGYLFVQALVGIDPGPNRLGYPVRLMLLIGTLTFHAFFGLALMQGDSLILADWYGAMGRVWGESPLADQKTGGAIAWGVGELPAAVLTLVVSIQWARSDERESRRLDRASDRGGNQDLEQYNAMLAELAKRKERRN